MKIDTRIGTLEPTAIHFRAMRKGTLWLSNGKNWEQSDISMTLAMLLMSM